MDFKAEVPMSSRSIPVLLAGILLAIGACFSFPLQAQTAAHVQRNWAVAPPSIPCFGSFGCGRRFDPRPAFAGALIGGVIAALSAPAYIDAPQVPPPYAQLPQRDPYGAPGRPTSQAQSIADGWQQFGESRRDTGNSSSQFIERWQRFFEPSQ